MLKPNKKSNTKPPQVLAALSLNSKSLLKNDSQYQFSSSYRLFDRPTIKHSHSTQIQIKKQQQSSESSQQNILFIENSQPNLSVDQILEFSESSSDEKVAPMRNQKEELKSMIKKVEELNAICESVYSRMQQIQTEQIKFSKKIEWYNKQHE